MEKSESGIAESINLEERLELHDSSSVVIYTCKPYGDFAATFISPGISAQLGWQTSDFLNDPSFWASHLHPDDKERVFAGLSTLFEEGHYSHEYRFQHKDGSYRWMNDDLRLDHDESGDPVRMVGYWMDITARRQAEQALRDSETRYRQLAELSPDGMYVHINGEIVFANASLARILAVPSPTDFLGTRAFDLLAPECHERISQRIDRLMNGEVLELEQFEYLCPDGSRVFTDSSATLISWDNTPAVLVLIRDISKLQQAEEALRQAQKMEAVGQLTGGVAHDFNNLLAVILGNVELLGDKIGDDQLLATINRAATRGADLTQRLLAFSRQQTLQPQSIDLAELVSVLHDLLHRTLGEPVEILTHVPEEVWPVFADPGQLENALLNLSINARDAMPNGGVLEIWCSNIELQEGDMRVGGEVAAGDYVQIAVRDTGIGMTEDTIERAFEPFYTTKDVGAGTGLGLSMVYGFALQSGGDAVIESDLGTGTEVKIFLPRSEVINASEEHTPDDDLKRGQGEAILVLEDDPDVRSLTVATLGGLGYQVLEAGDATAALQVLEDEAGGVVLLLSDVVLPGGVGGPEFAIKAKELCPKLKIVFMTGYASGLDTTEKILDIGEALLNKPFRRADLATVIHRALAA
jgi:PAS domain S-box-containing protein